MTLDLTGPPTVSMSDTNPSNEPECIVSGTTADLIALIASPHEASHMIADGRIAASSRPRAAQLLEALFPGALRRALAPELARAVLGEAEHDRRAQSATAEQFFRDELPNRLAREPGLFGSVRAAVAIEVAGAGSWTVDMTPPAHVLSEPSGRESIKAVIRTSRAAFEQILADTALAWPLFNDGTVSSSNACRAAQFVRGAFPGAFQRSMPPSLFRSLFPQDFYSPSHTELGGGGEPRRTYVFGPQGPSPISYLVQDGLAVYQGDIVLGTIEEMEEVVRHVEGGATKLEDMPRGVRIIGWPLEGRYAWPNGVVVYKNDVTHKPARVSDAIADWTSKTRITFKLRTTEANYVEIVEGAMCSSRVGMQGGKQQITLAKDCTTGSVIHEIGHTVGLFHEQARLDRDSYVKIIKGNIEAGKESQFDMVNSSYAQDLGAYDYGSIMHYGAYDFSRNGKATIETVPSGIAIGQRDGLSAKDIASVAAIYGPRPSRGDSESKPLGRDSAEHAALGLQGSAETSGPSPSPSPTA